MAAAAPQQEGRNADRLAGQVQPARGCERQRAGEFADYAGQSAMAQRVLQRQQHGIGPPGLGIDHPVRMQSHTGQGGGEQVALLKHPEHPPPGRGAQSGGEQRGRGCVLDLRADSRDFVQRGTGQTAAGQVRIQVRKAGQE